MHNFKTLFSRLLRVFLCLIVGAVPQNFVFKWICIWRIVSSGVWKFFNVFPKNSLIGRFLQNLDFSFFELLSFTGKISMNLVNSFFSLMNNTEGGLCAKFQACDAKFELFTAKKPKLGHFWPFFWLFLPKINICCLIWKLKFGSNMPLIYWDLHAKFQANCLKRLAVALPNIPGGPKVQNFGTFFCQL